MEKQPEVKAGNRKAATVSGERYILDFVSPTKAKAWTRKKIVNKSASNFTKKTNYFEYLKNKYAGQFTAGPPPIINDGIKEENVKNSNEAPTAIINARIPNNSKKNNIKINTKKNNTKKVTVAKKTVKAPPLPKYEGFFEKQQGSGCGRHALNNLLGRQAFVKGTITDKYVHGTSKEKYSMLGICNTIEEVFKKKGMKQSCLESENYDTNTMIAALDVLGYGTEIYHPIKDFILDESGDFLGFLANPGNVKGKTEHWVALKFKKMENDTGYYDYYDSLNKRPIENVPFTYYDKLHPNSFLIKVLLPQGQSIDPTVRIETLPNAAPPSPKQKTVKKTDTCTTLYDPCTKQPLKDMAALEARIAELKAKQVKL